MGWGVQVTTDVYVSRVSKDGVDAKIEENNDLIAMFEKELAMLAASTPRDVVSEETRNGGDVISELRIRIDEILEGYRDCIRENCLLQIIKEDIDKAEDC